MFIVLFLISLTLQIDQFYLTSLKNGQITNLPKTDLQEIISLFKHVVIFPKQPDNDIDINLVAQQIKETNKLPVFVTIDNYNKFEVFENQRLIQYRKQELVESEMVDFVKQIIRRELVQINTRDDFNGFVNIKNKNKVLFITEQAGIQQMVNKLVQDDIFAMSGNYEIGICSDQSIIPYPSNIQIENLVLYKASCSPESDNSQVYNGSLFAVEEIMEFLNLNSLELLNELNEDNLFRVFGGAVKRQFLIFLDKNHYNSAIIQLVKELALFNQNEEQLFQRFIFAILYNEPHNQEFFDYFGVVEQQLPKIFISENKDQELQKYEFTDTLNLENLKQFMEDTRSKKVKKSKKNEFLEDQSNLEIKKMNYENFQKEIINSRESSMVLFYTELADVRENSDSALKILKALQTKVKEVNPELKFYIYDIVKNDFSNLDLKGTPELRIYLKGEKKLPKIFKYDFNFRKVVEFYHVFFESNEIKMTYDEEDMIILNLMSEQDKYATLEARKRREKIDGVQEINTEQVKFQKWARFDYEAGINPVYKPNQNVERINTVSEKIEL